MNPHVFFGICVFAITMTTAYAQITLPTRPTIPTGPTLPTGPTIPTGPGIPTGPSVPTPTGVVPVTPPRPLQPCPGRRGGLIGFVQQLAYLVDNILINLDDILFADSQNSVSVIPALRGLLEQLQLVVSSLLGGSRLTNTQVATQQVRGQGLLASIVALLNRLLGTNQGSQLLCARPNGLIGLLLDGTLNLLTMVLTGSWLRDRFLMAGLLNQILSVISSLLASL